MHPANTQMYLSPPRVTDADIQSVTNALRSGWVAPVGPDLTAFEQETAQTVGVAHAVALNSGTSGLHLGLKHLGVMPGDAVLVPTVTFGATAFAVTYLGAEPVFIDVDASWNMAPDLLGQAIDDLAATGRRVAAAIPVDLYGTPADYGHLLPILQDREVAVLEDAAEGLGAQHERGAVGAFGAGAVLSFNGNKIITTSGGGMLVTDDLEFAGRVRHWSTQSRQPTPWYEHEEVGYNYRLSNILAALGRAQLSRLPDEVAARRLIREWYREELSSMPGLTVQDDPEWGTSNAWLPVVRFASSRYPDAASRVREHLARNLVESRPVWKPMHMQPVFSRCTSYLDGTAESLFREGLCLPTGSVLDEEDIGRVCGLIKEALR